VFSPYRLLVIFKVGENTNLREIQFLLSVTLTQTFNNRSSALTGAAITGLAIAEPFIASGAAAAFWSFFATEKGLGPRGYERDEIMIGWWVTPNNTIRN